MIRIQSSLFLKPARFLVLLLACFWGMPGASAHVVLNEDEYAAVIFAYHRIGEDQYPGINLRLDQFEAQIRELMHGDYNVAPLPDIIDALKNRTRLPPRTIALTFDGGHRSILDQAVPLLLRENLPFTMFIAPSVIDADLPDHPSWDELRRLSRNRLVTLGLHPGEYTRLSDEKSAEILRQVNTAKARFRQEIGREPALFSYPFGEHSRAYRNIVKDSGFAAAFGQQSGVAHLGADLFSLPRFTMTEAYGDLERFYIAAGALPLPVQDISPQDPYLDTDSPSIGFTVTDPLAAQLPQLSCFASGQDRPDIQIIGKTRVELRLERPFEEDRVRINCTLPGPQQLGDDTQHWRWFGMLFALPPSLTTPDWSTIELPEAGSADDMH